MSSAASHNRQHTRVARCSWGERLPTSAATDAKKNPVGRQSRSISPTPGRATASRPVNQLAGKAHSARALPSLRCYAAWPCWPNRFPTETSAVQ